MANLNPVSVTAVKDGDDVVRFILTGQPLVKRFGCSHLIDPDAQTVERVRAAVSEFGAETVVREARPRQTRPIHASAANARPSDAIQATRKVAQDWRAKYIELKRQFDALQQELEQGHPSTPDQIRALLHQAGLTPKQASTVYKHLLKAVGTTSCTADAPDLAAELEAAILGQ